jgi:hypothetical protein
MPRGLQISYTEQCEHSELSPRFSGDVRNQKSNRIYKIDWDDLETAIPQALGYPLHTGAGNLSRYLPHQDPNFPYLVAVAYEAKGKGRPSSEILLSGNLRGNRYTDAYLSLQFEKPLYHLVEDANLAAADTANFAGLGARWAPEIDRYVEYEERPEGSYITPPAVSAILAWSGPTSGAAFELGAHQLNQPVPSQVSKILGEANIVLRWHQVPDSAIPLTSIYSCLGRINQTDFGSYADERIQFNPWSMLFLGATFTRSILPTGGFGWTLEYLFKFSGEQRLWNQLLNPRATKPNFYQVSRMGATTDVNGNVQFTDPPTYFEPGGAGSTAALTKGKLIYDIANLNDLFTVPAP